MLKLTIIHAVATAREALGDLLISATIIKRDPSVHVPGSIPRYAETETSVTIYKSRYVEREIDGDRIRASDFKALVFLVDANEPLLPGATPEANDLIRDYGGTYRVIRANHVMAGDTIVLSEIQMRLS